MFENLTKNFTDLFEKIRKRGKFTKHLSKDSLKRVRDLLIDSDVSVLVAKKIVQKIEKEISKRKIYESFNPDKNFVKIVQKVLVQIIGEKFDPIRLSKNEDLIILMVGSKGSGKTTTTAKLGRVLRETYNKKVLLASTDVLRPAAFEQLKKLSSF
ncbi:signal recognition particle receptor subunit alpha [Candidatus Riesia pediculischaeffi]|uniref:Signal recognition particle SRP54 helical bundle domain-containing protein n=1 Tax=Candidatus Riesia pediculischaeffi TaxID=428411 RepID=A0A1V0HKX0_9ENTR|nr:signal recognition particle receptor subunit alpha [Candidatus Riesia pediculischaeffi]ARC53478.1 hypothetical protein AOQ87_02395 [Candidatus Riesia pediculischaeffi]